MNKNDGVEATEFTSPDLPYLENNGDLSKPKLTTAYEPLPRNDRKRILIGMILISSSVAFVNGVTGFSIELIYRYLYSSGTVQELYKTMEGLTGLSYLISFAVPSVIGAIYLWPALMTSLGRGGLSNLRTTRRRALNGPWFLGLSGITGWIAYACVYFYGVYLHNKPLFSIISLRLTVDSLFGGIMCFVLSYYIIESLTRKYCIEALFPDGKLSSCEGAFALTIRERLVIYFFSVSLFPFILFFEVFLSMMENYTGKITLAGFGILTASVALLGLWLTLIVAASYRKPLTLMKNAAKSVGVGNFDVRVPVMSNDETGALSENMNDMAEGLREKEFIKDTFGRMVDPSVRDHLLSGNVSLGGKIVETTILFTDIRGFTTLSENMSPEEVVELINRYFELMSPCVTDENGIVNKFIGDSLMAIFGAPLPLEDHAASAARAALRMAGALDELNAELSQKGIQQVRHGVGIHTGPVLAGNIGAGSRMEYTAIGDTVNTASRIQSLCKQFQQQILLSETTVEKLDGAFAPTLLGETEIRGKNIPIKIFSLSALTDEEQRA